MAVLEIHVVSYKRPAVMAYTLDSLVQYYTKSRFYERVNLRLALNEYSDEDIAVVDRWFDNGIPFDDFTEIGYAENMGKAYALNDMARSDLDPETTHIITMDGDMVFTDTYMEVFDTAAEHWNFDLIGFASKQFWGHYPLQEDTMYADWYNGYRLWYTMSIAGGIMMGSKEFLLENEWTNVDGIYGGDDFNMCFLTDSKFIIEDQRAWLVHDPIGTSIPELERYYAAKNYYRQQGLYVYPEGWYENAPVNQ